MKSEPTGAAVSIGFRVKTGKAVAVALRGPVDSPEALKREQLIFSDPKRPETWQPYHEVMDLPWEVAETKVQNSVSTIRVTAAQVVGRLIQDMRASGFQLCGAGIVGGSDHNPGKISNPHVRAHAAEGQLFRQVLESALEVYGLFRRSFVEGEIYQQAALEFGCSVAALRDRLSKLGQTVGRPWRADEKAAALAAWMVLGGHLRE